MDLRAIRGNAVDQTNRVGASDGRYRQFAPFGQNVPLESPPCFLVGPSRSVHERMSFKIVFDQGAEGFSAQRWRDPVKPFFDRRVHSLAHTLECGSRLAARLRWLDPTRIANREPAE